MGGEKKKVQKILKIDFFGKNIWPRRVFEKFADIFQKKTLQFFLKRALSDHCTKNFGQISNFVTRGVFRKWQPQWQPQPREGYISCQNML